ncbi:Insulin-like growth factor binding protein, N-terminal [Pseudocohnilembus persalinus]|uniref:Insulin-like growth factor binding protein, N-terminal n=1 Tax=Pseudocohnilembus persalinus TaxID=266149 RepID=A0A0V0QLU4_PSEPJ|nr:Insulin-like growth factor binding protein, N-terminal [Pseudocohnilembus persalinus]|eukprot:KRX02933.1 Insulin-like growth factor binding protein, N-terminal [Pseudocohnilembus persalinus]
MICYNNILNFYYIQKNFIINFIQKYLRDIFKIHFMYFQKCISNSDFHVYVFVDDDQTMDLNTFDYYNCDSINGVQFENDGDLAGYYWEKTLFFNEIMSPSFNKGNFVVSKFTLAFFKDSNWFADVDLNQADNFQWGKGNGCKFLDSCDLLFDEFVSSSSSEICSFDHTGKSYPNVDEFTDCHISFIQENQNCQDVNDLSNNYQQTGEINGQNSRCFESDYILSNYQSTSSARCYSYECDDELKKLKIFLSISGRIQSIICDENSEQISAPSGMNGNLKCPKNIRKFCQFNKPCENFCSNSGYCLQKENISECHCIENYSKKDCSEECDGVLWDDDIICDKKCKKKQYINQQNQCQDCHENCSFYCVGPNSSDCRICPQFQYLEGLSCVSSCSQNYFQDEQTGECKACIKDCQNGCIFSADNCLKPSFVDSGLFITDLDQYGQIQEFNIVLRIICIFYFISSL